VYHKLVDNLGLFNELKARRGWRGAALAALSR
jgi:hypothetical protein